MDDAPVTTEEQDAPSREEDLRASAEREQYGSRRPPQDLPAERAVLGSMMLSRAAIDEVLERVRGSDFYAPAHEIIFGAIVDLFGRGEAVDVLTVTALLTQRGEVNRVGGPLALHDLVAHVPLAANAAYYAEIVAGAAMQRRLVEVGTRIAQRAYSMEGTPEEAYEEAMSDLLQAEGPTRGEDYVSIEALVPETIEHVEALGNGYTVPGIPTGFIDLDALTGGLKPGQMVVVAGRPAMGKSTLAVDFCRSAAIRNGKPSCYFSLEMNRTELTQRIISAEAKVTLDKMGTGLLSDSDWMKVAQHMESVMTAPLFVDDSPNLSMTQIAAKARRLKAQHDLQFVVIDYLQLMTSGRRVESRQVEVSEFSRQIKLLAKELEVPIVALSQLNRGPEQRTNKRPMLSDLRESGSIEQDADLVILLHREDMYEAESTRPGEADLIVAKHRNGPTRDVVVVAQLHYARFVDMAQPA